MDAADSESNISRRMLIRSLVQNYGESPDNNIALNYWKRKILLLFQNISVGTFEAYSTRRSFSLIGENASLVSLQVHWRRTESVRTYILSAESKRAILLPHRQLHLPFILSLKIHIYMMVCCCRQFLPAKNCGGPPHRLHRSVNTLTLALLKFTA
jgi:hypothetical protein